MTRDEIQKKVQDILADSLGVDEDEVTPQAVLRDDLGAESIDYLDIQFRLEKAFGVSMDLLLKMQAGYDAAQARMHGDQIKVKRFKPDNARLHDRH